MPGGRPLKYKTLEELQKKIDEYFEWCEKKKKPLTVTGLAVWLDTSRETLLDYQEREEFSDAIKKAKDRIEQFVEEQLFIMRNPAGAIFNLTNNYRRWSNKQELTTPPGQPLELKTTSDEAIIATARETMDPDEFKTWLKLTYKAQEKTIPNK